jgi:hypothetical protein
VAVKGVEGDVELFANVVSIEGRVGEFNPLEVGIGLEGRLADS